MHVRRLSASAAVSLCPRVFIADLRFLYSNNAVNNPTNNRQFTGTRTIVSSFEPGQSVEHELLVRPCAVPDSPVQRLKGGEGRPRGAAAFAAGTGDVGPLGSLGATLFPRGLPRWPHDQVLKTNFITKLLCTY